MEGNIKVAPEKLIATATEFSSSGNTVSSLTQQMMTIVTGLSSIWTGEAASKFITKFSQLQEDIDQFVHMIQEHASDLEEMARNYENVESDSQDLIDSLLTDVIQ